MTTMDVSEKLVKQAISHFLYGVSHDIFSEPVTTYAKLAIEALKKETGATVQEWIPVKDRLPEPKEKAICLNRDGEMMIGTYTEWGWMFPCYFKSPTHWMPMPQLPKGE